MTDTNQLPVLPTPQPAQATQAEVADVVVGCLPTMNQDPYPALGDWWVQLWDGPSDAAMVIARVYGASPAEANEKAETIASAILALRPERVPMTPREIELIDGMIAVQLDHAQRCDAISNRAMAEKQKGWDMERVELLRRIRSFSIKKLAKKDQA